MPEQKIKGKVISLPEENGKGFQQRIALDAENLTALKAVEKALKDEGKGRMTEQLSWGREGHEYVYVSATPDAAMPGSGREVGDEIEIIVKVNGDYLNCIGIISASAKAKADAEKAKALREQAAALKENKAMMALLRSLKVNDNLSQLAIVQKVVGTEIGAGFGAALAAMQGNTDETPVSRSSKLATANKEKKKVLAKPDEDAKPGTVVTLTTKIIEKWEGLSDDELQEAQKDYAEITGADLADIVEAWHLATAEN